MKHEVGDLVKYHWHDWKCPPKHQVTGVVINVSETNMIEVFWTGANRTSLVFADALQTISKNNT